MSAEKRGVQAATATGLWSGAERAAWSVPAPLRPSEWAQRNRVLTRRQSSRPGRWDNRNNPPLMGIMDLCVHRHVRELWIKKAAQVGVSEAIRNVIARMAHQDPDPVLLVLPDEKKGRSIFRKRILPLFDDTAALAELATERKRDKTVTGITLGNGFDLTLGWSGSPSALASDPYRVVVLDETDKYDQTNAQEAPPEENARVRVKTYKRLGNDLIIGLSSPTTRQGVIHKQHEACAVQLQYFVPCPHCGTFSPIAWERIRWVKEEQSDALTPKQRAKRLKARGENGAWWECPGTGCGKKVFERDRATALWRGYWGTEDGGWKLWTDGSREEGTWPDGADTVGVFYPAQYDLALPWVDLACEWLKCGDDPGKIRAFRNNFLAEVYELQVTHSRADVFERKCKVPWPDKVVPAWASRLILLADTQKDHFWFVIRAWGWNFRSRRIHHGKVTSFEELTQLADATLWRYEGELAERYPPLPVYMSGIDSGAGKAGLDNSRTDAVYKWCELDPLRRKPLKGEADSLTPIRLRKHTYTPPGFGRSPYVVWLHLFSKTYFNDLLESAIGLKVHEVDPETGELHTGDAAPDAWELNGALDPEYNQHLASMHKVADRNKELWLPRTAGARFDYRSCEYMQLAMAHGPAMCGALPTADVLAAAHAARSAPPRKAGAGERPDWMPERPQDWTK